MNTLAAGPEAEKIRELQAQYAERGFEVVTEPRPEDIPFDLDGYLPDLLARKDGEQYLIEVRSSATRLSVDRFLEIIDEVRKHPGWDLILVTADDVVPQGLPGVDAVLPSWRRLHDRAAAAITLAEREENREAAFLAVWAALEGLLRKDAERASLPVGRMPSSALIKHLYSHGELSMGQYDILLPMLEVRNRVVHGFEAPELKDALRELVAVVKELLAEYVEAAA